MRKYRIIVVGAREFGDGAKGGGERYISELTAAMSHGEHDVVKAIVPTLFSLNLSTAPAATGWRKFRLLISEVRTADIIHIHQLNSPGFDYFALLGLIFRTPVVLTDHGGGYPCFGRVFGRWRLRLLAGAAFVSRWSQVDVDPNGVIKKTTILLGGGDHLSFSSSERFAVKRDFGYVGRLLPHKGVHLAISSLPSDMSLRIVGEVRDAEYFSELQRLAKGKDVEFVTDATDNDVAGLYKSVTYVVCPSVTSYRDRRFTRPELLGLTALESLAAGTPVIGSDVGGLGELLRKFGQLTVPDGDVKAWEQAMFAAAGQSDTPAARLEDVSWGSVAARCVGLFRSVVADTSSEQ